MGAAGARVVARPRFPLVKSADVVHNGIDVSGIGLVATFVTCVYLRPVRLVGLAQGVKIAHER
jgi:hypothetical protein